MAYVAVVGRITNYLQEKETKKLPDAVKLEKDRIYVKNENKTTYQMNNKERKLMEIDCSCY